MVGKDQQVGAAPFCLEALWEGSIGCKKGGKSGIKPAHHDVSCIKLVVVYK